MFVKMKVGIGVQFLVIGKVIGNVGIAENAYTQKGQEDGRWSQVPMLIIVTLEEAVNIVLNHVHQMLVLPI